MKSTKLNSVVALVPEKKNIDAISRVFEEELGTTVDVTEVDRPAKNGEIIAVYWWRTASADIIRGKAAFQYVQSQMVFYPATREIQIDFLCLPDGQKGRGKGRRILEAIIEVGRELGYEKIVIETIEGSYNFWLKVGFKPDDPKRTSFPRPMTLGIK